MKIVYRVLDKHTEQCLFESADAQECYKYVSDNSYTFTTIIRKVRL